MTEAFSFNREYDYVRLEGLYRATGRSAHEWDLYILKELIDNALDADETLWQSDTTQPPSLRIRMEYIWVPPPYSQQLLVRVGNRALFPCEQVQEIFNPESYISHKAFIKRLTRGALGNALKTLLGIPYALHNRAADDWKPDLKPISICCDKTEYLPRYLVDSTSQIIRLECEMKSCKPVEGTLISVGLDYFVQEIPRTLAEIETFAQLYHLCNPHARFDWTVEIGDQIWTKVYTASPGWTNKFQGPAPTQWYSLTAFKDLLGALYHKEFGNEKGCKLPLKKVCQYFAGFDDRSVKTNQIDTDTRSIIKALWQNTITDGQINGRVATALYEVLSKHSPQFDMSQLGCIGVEHVRMVLTTTFSIEGNIQYKAVTGVGNDACMPFVIEMAAARLQNGKRRIWTAINFSPTYFDPFLGRWLHSPTQPKEPVLGLRGLLDVYNFHEDTPFILFMHLICPNIEHTEFSKTEINHLPFEKVLGDVLDQVLKELKQSHEEEEHRLEQAIFQVLDAILYTLGEKERFVFDQLVEKLRMRLSQDGTLASWLNGPDAMSRLRMYIEGYQNTHPVIISHIARSAEGVLNIPSHPENYFSVPTEHISRELLAKHHVNKILYVQVKEIEPIVIDNGWLCHMDMALLCNPPGSYGLEDALLQCVNRVDLPILILHNADDASENVVKQMRNWLEREQLGAERIVDLGLDKTAALEIVPQPTKLVGMMPNELARWLTRRFDELGIAVKSIPSDADIRRDVGMQFEKLFEGYLLQSIRQRFGLTNLMIDLGTRLSFVHEMMKEKLDEQLKHRLTDGLCTDSYTAVLEHLVAEFFDHFMDKHAVKVQQIEQAWLTHRQSRETS